MDLASCDMQLITLRDITTDPNASVVSSSKVAGSGSKKSTLSKLFVQGIIGKP